MLRGGSWCSSAASRAVAARIEWENGSRSMRHRGNRGKTERKWTKNREKMCKEPFENKDDEACRRHVLQRCLYLLKMSIVDVYGLRTCLLDVSDLMGVFFRRALRQRRFGPRFGAGAGRPGAVAGRAGLGGGHAGAAGGLAKAEGVARASALVLRCFSRRFKRILDDLLIDLMAISCQRVVWDAVGPKISRRFTMQICRESAKWRI